ncbi:DUF559 domain-containing protein [Mesorhizobium sp. M8A.F.Ca.ET.181.01.1.1]|nr:DUF559 domain-containing protein [Mesorhizobium sp. M8A.F.Ca.ET.218.01.1.1]TGS48294.1 DUF559 domain-containing protein [Mesorhizobium sp. M8A.F.Ca.ET.182.01.1.1]TGS83416.1 DUF559 domain-containing protein [Mesorhizobium sp. M8A.F.Ca.ET.181.01.1.1]TGT16745.1 DUF559 domain-containing protein [Mesorhizobium sp. M8A.F.Ca.ET.213.01.1.1]
MPRTRVSFEMRQKARADGDLHEHEKGKRHDAVRDAYLRSLGFDIFRVDEPDVINSAWHVAQAVKGKVELMSGDPTRPLRGYPPLEGEGDAAQLERF